jgi:hypothetical protein
LEDYEEIPLAKRFMDRGGIAFLKQAIVLGVEVYGEIGLA